MNVPQAVRLLLSKQRARTPMNAPYPPTGRSGFPVDNAQPGGR